METDQVVMPALVPVLQETLDRQVTTVVWVTQAVQDQQVETLVVLLLTHPVLAKVPVLGQVQVPVGAWAQSPILLQVRQESNQVCKLQSLPLVLLQVPVQAKA
jgi:hypothetical protein